MAEQQSSSPSINQSPLMTKTKITGLGEYALAPFANYLNPQDISNLAVTCKDLKRAAYSDTIWLPFFREQWPQEQIPPSEFRAAYLARHTGLQKFKFDDPLVSDFYTDAKRYDHMLLDKNDIFFSQGALIRMRKIDRFLSERDSLVTLRGHGSRITCMRLFSLNETSLVRSETQSKENVLVTSSCDHTIRLWRKDSCQQSFIDHKCPVSTLSDKLLGDGSDKVLASGGEDGTVRLWSLKTSGRHALKATLRGHEKPIELMSVAGVWDTARSSAVGSSRCMGKISVPESPVNMKCHESLVYVAAGSSVSAIDLRTMQKVITAAAYQPNLYSVEIMPSKSLICTGGDGRAMLWDIRQNQERPISKLRHSGSVTFLLMDPYKIVTGGPGNFYVNVWEVDTGTKTNSLICCPPEPIRPSFGCAALAVNGCRIVTASYCEQFGFVRFRDFTNATRPAIQRIIKKNSLKMRGCLK